MKIHSLRVRLLVSYALIALLAALLLGGILIGTLYNHYAAQERAAMSASAAAIAASLASPPPDTAVTDVQNLVTNLSFFANARIRIIDAQGRVFADSGTPSAVTSIALDPAGVSFSGALAVEGSETIILQSGETALGPAAVGAPPVIMQVTGGNSPVSGFVLSSPADGAAIIGKAPENEPRSGQHVSVPLTRSDGQVVGYVEMSEGPAYGRQILTAVTWAWAAAGSIAVLLAALAGWLFSRRLSQPLVDLTRAASEMAAGNMTVRTGVNGSDEIGLLAGAFNDMSAQVQAKVETLQRFVSDAAHELYTPLTALQTNLELAEDEPEPSTRKVHLDQALGQVRRMDALTRGLLNLSRLEAGQARQKFTPVDLAALLPPLCEPFAAQAEQRDVRFDLHLPGEALLVNGDPAILGAAVHNLLDNALKFTPSGGQVSLHLQREAGLAVVEVRDTGIGVEPADRQAIFERFHRGRNAAAYPGSGLGLAFVHAVAELHGGSVQLADTEAQEGAAFILEIPTA